MSTALVYLVVLVVSHVIGACLGNVAGLLFGVATKSEYIRRLVRGLVFGSATVIASVYVLRWLARPAYLVFVAVLVGTFVVLTVHNNVKVKTAMRTHTSNAIVHTKLSELSRTRLVQDLTAVISALISSLIAYARVA